MMEVRQVDSENSVPETMKQDVEPDSGSVGGQFVHHDDEDQDDGPQLNLEKSLRTLNQVRLLLRRLREKSEATSCRV